jgi:hypothetical protein
MRKNKEGEKTGEQFPGLRSTDVNVHGNIFLSEMTGHSADSLALFYE